MEIQFKKETLFDKFGISSTLSKGDLMRLFQTRPELRKELPVYIQIINNEQKLYLEELFSTYIDGQNYTIEKYLEEQKSANTFESVFDTEISTNISPRKKLAALVDLVRRFDYTVSKLKISGKIFDDLIKVVLFDESLKSYLTYARADKTDEIFTAFCECLWLEIDKSIGSQAKSLNSKTVNAVYRILNAVSDLKLKKRFMIVFAETTAENLDSISLRLDDKSLFSSSLEFVCGLNAALFKNKEFYRSYKAFCNQLANNLDKNSEDFLQHFAKLIERLHPEDAEYLCNLFVNVCFTYILFDNIEKNTYSELQKMSSASDVLQYIKDNDIECEHIEIIEILSALIKNGAEWYDYYRQRIISIKNGASVSQNLYDVARLIYKSERLKNHKTIFANLLIRVTNFETATEKVFSKLNSIAEAASSQYGSNDYVKALALRQFLSEKQSDIRNLILKYYALTILAKELVETFDTAYSLLLEKDDINTAKYYMRKCDEVRGASRSYSHPSDNIPTRPSYSGGYSSSYSSGCCGGCYVATCVYGSYDCPQVWTLRRFRDNTLGSTWYGRAFIKIYYAISPTLVKWFGKTKWFKKMWKGTLDRIVKKLQDSGVESTPYEDKKW